MGRIYVNYSILSISVNTPNVLLFNLQKDIHQFKCQDGKFWSFKTTNVRVIVFNGTLAPHILFPLFKHIEKKNHRTSYFKCSIIEVVTALGILFNRLRKASSLPFFKCSTTVEISRRSQCFSWTVFKHCF